jgi:hypothetical protein
MATQCRALAKLFTEIGGASAKTAMDASVVDLKFLLF